MSRPSRVTIGVIALRNAVAHDHVPLGQRPSPARSGCSPPTSFRSCSSAGSGRRSPPLPPPAPAMGGASTRISPGTCRREIGADPWEDRELADVVPNRYRDTSPSQKTGAEMNARLVTMVMRSSSDLRLTALMIPTGSPINSHNTTEPATSSAVAGRRSKMVALTGVFDWIAPAEVQRTGAAMLIRPEPVERREDLRHIAPELLRHRFAEPELLADLLDQLRVGLPAGTQLGGVGAREDVEEHEDHRADQEEHRDAPQHPADYVAEHPLDLPAETRPRRLMAAGPSRLRQATSSVITSTTCSSDPTRR